MKNGLVKFSLIGIVFLFLFSAAGAQTKKVERKIVEPTAKESIKQILLNGNLLLRSYESCRSYATSEEKTVGDYLASIISFQATPDGATILDFTFTREKTVNGETLWVCDLIFRLRDIADTSTNGFRFKMRNADRKLMRDSLMCIGSG